jgi:hypothetical protein
VDDFPEVPHADADVDCIGCIVQRVRGPETELVCDECNLVVGTVNTKILRDLLRVEKASRWPWRQLRPEAILGGAHLLRQCDFGSYRGGKRGDDPAPHH